MTKPLPEIVQYFLYDQLADLPNVSHKSMFGGYGFYLDDKIFGIFGPGDQIYLKNCEATQELMDQHDCEFFVYTGHKNRKPTKMPYRVLPEAILEDRQQLLQWVQLAAGCSR